MCLVQDTGNQACIQYALGTGYREPGLYTVCAGYWILGTRLAYNMCLVLDTVNQACIQYVPGTGYREPGLDHWY